MNKTQFTRLSLQVFLPLFCLAQQRPEPIIDMHMHAFSADSQGPPPMSLCAPAGSLPPAETGSSWPSTFMAFAKTPACDHPLQSPMTDRELMDRTLSIMKQRNIIGVASGPLVDMWKKEGGDRIVPGLYFSLGKGAPSVEELKTGFKDGRYRVLGEIMTQYQGIDPSDPRLEPYLAVSEELDIPVGIHVGPGPPGAPYLGSTSYRARMHSPFGLEEALLRHPKLRVYAMHAGWPMLDDMLAMLWTHPQLYVDIGIISWGLPRATFHNYLNRIVEAGFGKRVLFGSDQMVWPEAIDVAIESIEKADFLQPDQKRDILYNNAARFLRLTPRQIAQHHAK